MTALEKHWFHERRAHHPVAFWRDLLLMFRVDVHYITVQFAYRYLSRQVIRQAYSSAFLLYGNRIQTTRHSYIKFYHCHIVINNINTYYINFKYIKKLQAEHKLD